MKYANFFYSFFCKVFFVLMGLLFVSQCLLHIPGYQGLMNYALYLESQSLNQYLPYGQSIAVPVKYISTDGNNDTSSMELPLLQNGHVIQKLKRGEIFYLPLHKGDVIEIDGTAVAGEGIVKIHTRTIPLSDSLILLSPHFVEKILEEGE